MTKNEIKRFRNERKKHCGNWAGYSSRQDLSYCGWMDFHNDLDDGGATKSESYFTIDIKYATNKGKLVHKVNGKFVATKLRAGMKVKFDASKLHAFLPNDIADKCIAKQSIKPQSKMQWNQMGGSTKDSEIRIVWRFVQ